MLTIQLHVQAMSGTALLQMLEEILAAVEKFPMNSCEVSFKAGKKVFMKCMGISPLMSCKKP
jgi:hypothetical protein